MLVFLLLFCLTYIGILWAEEYSQFLETGQPVAINGRYLLPLLLPLAAVLGTALREALRVVPAVKPWLAALAIAAFLHGGGVMSFMLRTDTTWNWPEPTITDDINHAARTVLSPVIFEGSKYY
jgi:hypothetical protein